jgi:hypothetical protein
MPGYAVSEVGAAVVDDDEHPKEIKIPISRSE